jgi:general secretion pathway protein D
LAGRGFRRAIRLEIAQEASSIAQTQLTSAADLITQRRAVNTTVLADNGQTIVLGGLITDDRQQIKSQVPVLGDIPIVGELFKSRRENRTKRTLFIFLKPTIIRNSDDARAVTDAKYGRLRGDEANLRKKGSLLLNPPGPRLTMEIEGVY